MEAEACPPLPSLSDLDEAVLIQIVARLPQPHALSCTCTALHAVSTSSLARQLWFARWQSCHPAACRTPLVLAALAWRGSRVAAAAGPQATAVAPALHTSQQQEEEQQHAVSCSSSSNGSVASLLQLLRAAVQHNKRTSLGSDGSGARPQHEQQQQQQQEHAVSAADITAHLQRGTHLELLQRMTPWHEHLLLPAVAAAGHDELLQQLLAAATPTTPPPPSPRSSSSGGNGSGGSGIQQQQRRAPRCRLQRPLPAALGLGACRHDVLQTCLLSAARAGRVRCLQALVAELVASPREPLLKLDLLLAAAEAAAARGHLDCLDLIWQATGQEEHGRRPHQQQQHRQRQQGQQQRQHRQGRQQQHEPEHEHEQQQAAGAQQEARGEGGPDAEGPLVQLQRQLTLCALQHLSSSSSSYLLVAAAGSGSTDVLGAVLARLHPHIVKQQLPAALTAAGRPGHVGALRALLASPEMSARPLQIAALDAAGHGWPAPALAALLDHAAAAHREELLQLLARPLVAALQAGQRGAADALLALLMEACSVEQPELLADPLLLLAYQGRADAVSWVLRVAPTVLVRLGQRAAAAALEGGHPSVAQLILDAGGERPPAFRAAAKRGELTAAVAAADVGGVRALLREVGLPLVWACEALPASGAGGAVHRTSAAGGPAAAAVGGGGAGGMPAAAAAAAGGGQQQQQPFGHGAAAAGAAAGVLPALVGDGPVIMGVQGSLMQPTRCLLTLLQAAALRAPHPQSVQLLHLLLPALAQPASAQVHPSMAVLVGLAKACMAAGRVRELQTVLDLSCGGPGGRPPRAFVRALVPFLTLPHSSDTAPAAAAAAAAGGVGGSSVGGSEVAAAAAAAAPVAPAGGCGHQAYAAPPPPPSADDPHSAAGGGSDADGSTSTSTSTSTTITASGSVAAALALMGQPGVTDVLSTVIAHVYLSVSHPGEYLGALARPMLPAAFIPGLQGLRELLWALVASPRLPPGARVRDGPMFRLAVRAVLQACDGELLLPFLALMEAHGAVMLEGAPGDVWDGLAEEEGGGGEGGGGNAEGAVQHG